MIIDGCNRQGDNGVLQIMPKTIQGHLCNLGILS